MSERCAKCDLHCPTDGRGRTAEYQALQGHLREMLLIVNREVNFLKLTGEERWAVKEATEAANE